MKAGLFKFGGDATAVVVTVGASISGQIASGRTVYVAPHGGLMAGISLSGQSIGYAPRG